MPDGVGAVAALDWRTRFNEDGHVPVGSFGPDLNSPPAAGLTPDGALQVVEPPPSLGLLDTIVGDVVASYLGK